ncbi:MAG: hypothetical protein ACFCD0_17025 [Gemmataceae bacterium]
MAMSSEHWSLCGDPNEMLRELKDYPSPRPFWLFSIECCRRIWHMLPEEPSRQAVEMAQLWVDSKASRKEVERAYLEAFETSLNYERFADQELRVHGYYYDAKTTSEIAARRCAANVAKLSIDVHAIWNIAYDAATAAARESIPDSARRATQSRVWNSARDLELANQCDIIRDIFEYPFEQVRFDPQWKSEDVHRIAELISEKNNFSQLPILADALEEAGCDEELILHHCREGLGHVRGCWVVDLILAKS